MVLIELATSDRITIIATLISSLLAVYGVYRANVTASAATFVTLNEGFRQAWHRYLHEAETPQQKQYELAELMNLLEIACAIRAEWSIMGNARELVNAYLNDILAHMIEDEEINDRVPELLGDNKTFKFIKKFIDSKPALSVTIPPKWYQNPSGTKS